jgi:hypothetical protein
MSVGRAASPLRLMTRFGWRLGELQDSPGDKEQPAQRAGHHGSLHDPEPRRGSTSSQRPASTKCHQGRDPQHTAGVPEGWRRARGTTSGDERRRNPEHERRHAESTVQLVEHRRVVVSHEPGRTCPTAAPSEPCADCCCSSGEKELRHRGGRLRGTSHTQGQTSRSPSEADETRDHHRRGADA